MFNPDMMIKDVLLPLIESCFSKALHIRHGAILGVSEIIIGLSGKSMQMREDALKKAYLSLSVFELRNLKDSDNQVKFKAMFEKISAKNYLPEHFKDD